MFHVLAASFSVVLLGLVVCLVFIQYQARQYDMISLVFCVERDANFNSITQCCSHVTQRQSVSLLRDVGSSRDVQQSEPLSQSQPVLIRRLYVQC